MNTNYDSESTRVYNTEEEKTQYVENQTAAQAPAENSAEEQPQATNEAAKPAAKSGKGMGAKIATGVGTGLLLGGVAGLTMGMKSGDAEANTEAEADGSSSNSNNSDLSNPEWVVDDQIQVAGSVNDDMSFSEAFAAARHEVGPGGCFEWHGQLYGTYTAEEWNNMTPEERAEYSDHFNWNHIDTTDSDVHTQSNEQPEDMMVTDEDVEITADPEDIVDIPEGQEGNETPSAENGDDIEIISVNPEEPAQVVEEPAQVVEEPAQVVEEPAQVVEEPVQVVEEPAQVVEEPIEVVTEEPIEVVTEEPTPLTNNDQEVEILGVFHDDELDANIGVLNAGGQNVIFMDVDNDLTFDVMASDLNNNGQLDDGELVNISEDNITVDDMGGFTDPASDVIDGPDYIG